MRSERIKLADVMPPIELFFAGKPDGYPVLYFHGCPGSGEEIALLEEEALKNDLFLISFTRTQVMSAFGKQNLKIPPFEYLSKAILEHLNLTANHMVVAFSGGAVYAINYIHIQAGGVSCCALISPFFLTQSETVRAPVEIRIKSFFFRHLSFLLWPFFKQIQRSLLADDIAKQRVISSIDKADYDLLSTPDHQHLFSKSLHKSFAFGCDMIVKDLQHIGTPIVHPSEPYDLDICSWSDFKDSHSPVILMSLLPHLFSKPLIRPSCKGYHYQVAAFQDEICRFLSNSFAYCQQ